MKYGSGVRTGAGWLPAFLGLLLAAGLVATTGYALGLFAQEADDYRTTPYLRIDPERTLISRADGFVPCGECHTSEWEVWQETQHAQGFEEMHRSAGARDIMQQLGLRTTKRQEALCMRCHYTVGENHRAVAGVSCESCHGPARDWIDIHNRYEPGVSGPEGETPQQREARIRRAVEAGMLRPLDDIYGVAANCLECHTVPAEELVNEGGHSTGSSGFDLVDRVDRIRHNFIPRDGAAAEGVNRPLSPERRRKLFVVGRILGYEYSLRGMAEATATGRYASAMNRRVTSAYRDLEAVAQTSEIPEVVEILGLGADLQLVPDNRAVLEGAAERVRSLGRAFSDREEGVALAALDPLIAGEQPALPTLPTEAGASEAGAEAPGADPEASAPGGPPAEVVEAEAPAAPPELPGQVRTRPAWFPSPGSYSMVGPGECGSCHGEAEDWWFGDPHQNAGRRLFGEDPRAREIAELYGIGAAGMARPDQLCLTCHGTVDPSSRQLLETGVSCESCHGPGSGFLEPHEDGGNPQLGMTALKEASVRAQTCAGCHHISDERLLAAGHPSGSDYNIAQAMSRIEHWPGRRPTRGRDQRGEPAYQPLSDANLQAAFASAVQGRPIPDVTVVARAAPRPARAPAAAPSQAPAAGSGGAPAPRSRAGGGSAIPPRPPASRPPRDAAPTGGLGLDPVPDDLEDLSPEDLLLLVKQRLEQIYSALGRSP